MSDTLDNGKINPRFRSGEAAPDGTLLDENGQQVTLSSIWEKGPVLLVMLRHFG